jgi:hypothetical protein
VVYECRGSTWGTAIRMTKASSSRCHQMTLASVLVLPPLKEELLACLPEEKQEQAQGVLTQVHTASKWLV